MGLLEIEDDGELVLDLDVLGIDRLVPEVDQREGLPHLEVLVVRIHDPLVAELDCRGVHRRPVVELDPVAQMEGVDHAIVGDVVALRERGLGGEARCVVFEKILEDVAHHRVVVLAGAGGDIHRGGFGHDHRDQRAALLSPPAPPRPGCARPTESHARRPDRRSPASRPTPIEAG